MPDVLGFINKGLHGIHDWTSDEERLFSTLLEVAILCLGSLEFRWSMCSKESVVLGGTVVLGGGVMYGGNVMLNRFVM